MGQYRGGIKAGIEYTMLLNNITKHEGVSLTPDELTDILDTIDEYVIAEELAGDQQYNEAQRKAKEEENTNRNNRKQEKEDANGNKDDTENNSGDGNTDFEDDLFNAFNDDENPDAEHFNGDDEGETVFNSPMGSKPFVSKLTTATHQITSDNALSTYDGLLVDNATTEDPLSLEHNDHLRSLIGMVTTGLSKIGEAITLTIYKGSDKRENHGQVQFTHTGSNITLTTRPNSADSVPSMGAQETFAHEYIHPLWRWGLNNSSSIREEARRLFNTVLNAVPEKDLHKLFLRGPGPHSPEAIILATARYKHVFRNGSNAGLDEFLTSASTNEIFMKNISSIMTKASAAPKGFKDKLYGLVRKILGLFIRELRTIESKGSVRDGVAELFMSMQDTINNTNMDNSSRGLLNFADDAMNALDDTGKALTRSLIDKTLGDSTSTVLDKHNKDNPTETMTMPEAYGEMVRIAANKATDGIPQSVRDIGTSLFGNTMDASAVITAIGKGKQAIDVRANELRTTILNTLLGMGTRDLVDFEHSAINNSIGKTDLSSLMTRGFDETQLVELLTDPRKVTAEISKINNELSSLIPSPHIAAINGHSIAMGNHLINGDNSKGSFNNNAISMVKRVSRYAGKITDEHSVAVLADSLISLHAIQHLDPTQTSQVASLYADSATKEKVTSIIALQGEVKRAAQRSEFSGKKAVFFKKGHYTQITDSSKDVRIASLSSEADLKKSGYKLKEKVTVGRGVFGSKPEVVGLYVSNFGGRATRTSSAFLASSSMAYGKSLTSMAQDMGKVVPAAVAVNNFIIMERDARAETRAFMRGLPTPANINKDIIPVVDSTGEITSFRLNIITDEFKIKHLGMKSDYVQSLANSTSKLVYRVNTPIHNLEVAEEVIKTYHRDYKKDPNAFYVLNPHSKLNEFDALFAKLDTATKRRLVGSFPEGKIYIKKNQFSYLFSVAIPTVADIRHRSVKEDNAVAEGIRVINNVLTPFLSNKYAVAAEHLTMDYVGELAKAIVVKTGSVMTFNYLAGHLISGLTGMNPLTTLVDSTKGMLLGVKYLELQDKVAELTIARTIEQGKSKPNRAKTGKLTMKINGLNAEMSRSPLHSMVQEGHLSTVVSDGSSNRAHEFNSRGAVRRGADKYFFNKVPKFVGDAVKVGLVMEDTALFNAMQTGTIMTDLGFKYAMKLHLEKTTNYSPSKINARLHYIFVGYDQASPRGIAYLERMGLAMFTKFAFRTQRVAISSFGEAPARAIVAILTQNMLMNANNIFSTSWLMSEGPQRLLNNPFNDYATLWDNPVMELLLAMAGF